MKRYFVVLVCVICIASLLAVSAQGAAPAPESSKLTLHYYVSEDDKPLANSELFIYLVATLDEGGKSYTLVPEFADYNVGVDLTAPDWNDADPLTVAAGTLSAYAARDGIEPVASGFTDENGYLTFNVNEPGIYLLRGDSLTVKEEGKTLIYTPQSLLIPLPYPASSISWITDVEIDLKYDVTSPDTVNITVKKVWEDEGDHPKSVTAQLLRNGEVEDEVELNAGNSWQHTWKNLESEYVWQVVEKEVPEGYKVVVSQEKNEFTITNTLDKPEEPPETEPPETEPPETEPPETEPPETEPPETEPPETEPSETEPPVTEPPETKPNVPDEPGLPQTGQLLWPAPVCIGGGILMFAVGLLLRRRDDESEYDSDEENHG